MYRSALFLYFITVYAPGEVNQTTNLFAKCPTNNLLIAHFNWLITIPIKWPLNRPPLEYAHIYFC